MLTSALIMSCGALAVALMEDRVPVFEIVVCHWPCGTLHDYHLLTREGSSYALQLKRT